MQPKELEYFLSKTILQKMPVMIYGSPGVGKTEIVEQAAKEAQADIITFHPVISDPTDFKGLPYAKDGEAMFLPYGDLKKLINADKLTVAFMDDIGQAPMAVQASLMQLFRKRELDGRKISDHVVFIAATNSREDRAGVSSILEPVKSRFCTIINLNPSVTDWSQWAVQNDISPELIAFIRAFPDYLSNFKPTKDMKNSPSPRTIENADKMFKLLKDDDENLLMEALTGSAGSKFAVEFTAFYKSVENLPSKNEIYNSPETAKIPEEISLKFAVTTMLGSNADKDNLPPYAQYIRRLDREFQFMFFSDIIKRDETLAETGVYNNWAIQNRGVFAA